MAEDRLNEGQASILCMSDISNKVINPLTWSRGNDCAFRLEEGLGCELKMRGVLIKRERENDRHTVLVQLEDDDNQQIIRC